MAHEEEIVKPVASDMDFFLIGSRKVHYPQPVPSDQIGVMTWMLNHVEEVLETESPEAWMTRWLDVLISATEAGTKPKVAMPPLGFGDPVSYDIIEQASQALHVTGAVRHGAECFNYLFPQVRSAPHRARVRPTAHTRASRSCHGQDLDDELLVCYDGFMGPPDYHQVPWQYLHKDGLVPFLKARIKEGYAVPLNPKWVLADRGYYELFEDLLASDAASGACAAWYPPGSGVRERIREIHARFPHGFVQSTPLPGVELKTMSAEEAEWELRRRECLRNAKKKLRAFSVMTGVLTAKKERKRTLKRAFTTQRITNFVKG